MGKNSRERPKAKRKAAEAAQRRRAGGTAGYDEPLGLFGAPRTRSQSQLAEQIIDQAVHAQHCEATAELDRCRALLTAGPGGTSGIQIVNRVLLACLLREVEHAWRRGWQPTELVRVARREYSPRHGRLVVDVIAAQMRSYSTATVDPRWQSQLGALDVRVWWEHDDHYVTVWGERQDLDRTGVIAVIVEVLHLLVTLPPIERVGPMPGTARAAAVAPPADLDQRMLDRVRALLAKAESTDFPEEADAFTAKAQELMARHRIDHALLAAKTGERDKPVTRRVGIDNPYEAPKTLLLQVVAEANSCRAVWTKRFGFTTIVGFPADLESTELLFTSLLVQATRAMTQAKPSTDRYGRNTTRSFRQSFLTAYASRIGERLDAATEGVDREMNASADAAQLLPVLAARGDAVRDVFEKQFPELTQQSTTISNRAGWASGRAAADRASLHGRQAVAPD
ncbi:Protein of unknown function [Micromonospora phaseoli]|uniref:Uncharacterized protein n=1 Tax=Micromonospora phaseoli TaxID=1144548 RepID=A0A1H7B6J2_9ACTN|nr:DUF2786 domain-containing protein [Micromonospora phaseoli]PZV96175.1 uncharacterized protein DUF2786 [Micromonospora phaseoli]GIJ79451.1 hypothetical protein Xph01_38830 [Micromonospora phaseoli]SEJ69035.1 Protein of unknown function [Micromonospora phaseoli]